LCIPALTLRYSLGFFKSIQLQVINTLLGFILIKASNLSIELIHMSNVYVNSLLLQPVKKMTFFLLDDWLL